MGRASDSAAQMKLNHVAGLFIFLFNCAFSFNEQRVEGYGDGFVPFRLEAGCASVFNSATVTHVLAERRLDYCNSLFVGLPAGLFSHLLLMQNAAAHLLADWRMGNHITPACVILYVWVTEDSGDVFVSHSLLTLPLYLQLFFIIHSFFLRENHLKFYNVQVICHFRLKVFCL